MPFVQRVVQPIHLAQVAANNGAASASARATKFQCIPGKCQNNNCISNKPQQQTRQSSEERNHQSNESRRAPSNGADETTTTPSRTAASCSVKDTQKQQQQQTTTTATIHAPQQNGDDDSAHDLTDHHHNHHALNHTSDFASSFSFATDTGDGHRPLSPADHSLLIHSAPPLPMKKLKQHVEFLSTTPSASSPSRSLTRSNDSQAHLMRTSQRRRTPQSATAAKIISGYEFDSISNITLSNALRQLASLVLIASDIFDELQRELQSVGDRARIVQRKIVAVERRVCAYDPKMVTVPESDLLTFAQRKTHYDCDKAFRKELFTTETRPRSVRVLYDDAGKVSPPPSSSSAAASPRSPTSFTSDGGGIFGDVDMLDYTDTGATTAAGSDELVCTPVFGKANRKMRTRIDAEIEIRLPAALDDLRKWTSSEALGDVTVTPDCMHHVDTSISTSVVIGDNGILTPALSPSVLSADAVDALYSINVSNAIDNTQIPNDINKDVPLNHRLPSPEEQCKIIALRYPAEVISVDTSGKRFQRMCLARKSTTGCFTNMPDANNLNDDVQTVSRRSRSRKVRGKRRNTIAGIDQKEIQDAANGDSTATSGEIKNTLAAAADAANNDASEDADASGRRSEKSKKFGRSKSSDILKKESVALPYDKGKSTLTRLNSLKQWGRNRFRFMHRNEVALAAIGSYDTSGCSTQNTSIEKAEVGSGTGGSSIASNNNNNNNNRSSSKPSTANVGGGGDIDDECIVHELISQKSEGRFSHERKPSYSSSEKSMSVSSSGHLKGKLHLATCGNVKLRDTSSLNRQRRNGISANGLAGKDEQPHSSSGNWSASSESGRASIGSEITMQPKSSASNTSLNVSSFHPGSGPPSSMMSRRRFMNTSASSSVTSEGTATPDLQVTDGGSYPNHLDDETSSAYSCDTEGYYTSFHMDSGLRTLKEEEVPMTPLQKGKNLHTSNYSFGSQSNQTVLTAENEYELFGRGSTSTTTSSAGTVCTTLMANGEQSSLTGLGPDVPERISSLGKLNKSNHSNSTSTSTLERSYSSSTIGSTLERTGTIKRNVNAGLTLSTAEGHDDVVDRVKESSESPESQEEEFDFEQRIRKRSAQPLPTSAAIVAEVECSESSDLEGVERIERIKQKTAINAKRIPSMCIITPSTSDDENQAKDGAFDPNKTLTNESSPCSKASAKAETAMQFGMNEASGYCTVDVGTASTKSLVDSKDHNLNVLKRNSNYGFNNMLEKLKVVLPNIKRSPSKCSQPASAVTVDDDDLYDTAGEYVTIADISNNNRHNQLPAPNAVGASSLGIYYSNDIVRRKLHVSGETTKGNEPTLTKRETEYVSLNELPYHLRKIGGSSGGTSSAALQTATFGTNYDHNPANHYERGEQRPPDCAESLHTHSESTSSSSAAVPMYAEISEVRERSLISPLPQNKGARVRVNAQGKIIYDSDSLKRRKGAHTTFAPGPYVKETESALPEIAATSSSSYYTVGSESALSSANCLVPKPTTTTTTAAKLLLLNGGVAANRNIANVRPIIATSPPTQRPSTANNMSISSGTTYLDQPHAAKTACTYQENKNLLANHSNPFFQPAMMPSPSTKSTSSTGSTISSTTSTNTTGSSSTTSSSSKEEGYQRFYKTGDKHQPQQAQPMHYRGNLQASVADATPFQRNTPVYWTLQNRRPQKPQASSATSRDDLYATPIRRSERAAAAAARAAASAAVGGDSNSGNVSPIVPRLRSGFLTSTPTKGDTQLPADNIPAKQPSARNTNWDDNSPERLNTCSDRIGQSKTSLLDFKKLLLAKSAKNSPVQKKMSAVELLKKSTAAAAAAAGASGGSSAPSSPVQSSINSSMKLLDLSGSPKTFANRRMLRQGQFGSPSKTFVPKIKTSPATWRNNAVQRTDIMSSTIPEVNSEEDQSNTSGSSNGSKAGSVESEEGPVLHANLDASAAQRFDLKRNFFLQTEENNFMRGELKPTFGKGTTAASGGSVGGGSASNKYVSGPVASGIPKMKPLVDTSNFASSARQYTVRNASEIEQQQTSSSAASAASMPALETAL